MANNKPTIYGDKVFVETLYQNDEDKDKHKGDKKADYKRLKDNYPNMREGNTQFGASIDFNVDDYLIVDQILSG